MEPIVAAAGVLGLLLYYRKKQAETQGSSEPPPADRPPSQPPAANITKTFDVEWGGAFAQYPWAVPTILDWATDMAPELVAALKGMSGLSGTYAESLSGATVTRKGVLAQKFFTFYGGIMTALAHVQVIVTYPASADPVSIIKATAFYRALLAGEAESISLESIGVPISGKATRAGAITPV